MELKAGEELLLNRKIAKFINKLKGENPEMEKLVGKVTEYNEDLKALDLRDEEINDISRKYSNDIVPVVKSLGLFALSTIYVFSNKPFRDYAIYFIVFTWNFAYGAFCSNCKCFSRNTKKKSRFFCCK